MILVWKNLPQGAYENQVSLLCRNKEEGFNGIMKLASKWQQIINQIFDLNRIILIMLNKIFIHLMKCSTGYV